MIELLYILVGITYLSIILISIYCTYTHFLEETESYLVWEDDVVDYYMSKVNYHLIYTYKVVTLQVFYGLLKGRAEDIDFWNWIRRGN